MSKKKKPQPKIESRRGVASLEEASTWLTERGIEDIECIVPDLAGVARGKMMPTEKFFSGPVMTMPSSIFAQTISGDYPPDDERFQHNPTDGDLFFRADYATLTRVPWESDPTCSPSSAPACTTCPSSRWRSRRTSASLKWSGAVR